MAGCGAGGRASGLAPATCLLRHASWPGGLPQNGPVGKERFAKAGTGSDSHACGEFRRPAALLASGSGAGQHVCAGTRPVIPGRRGAAGTPEAGFGREAVLDSFMNNYSRMALRKAKVSRGHTS